MNSNNTFYNKFIYHTSKSVKNWLNDNDTKSISIDLNSKNKVV
jgi:hypothetical protein